MKDQILNKYPFLKEKDDKLIDLVSIQDAELRKYHLYTLRVAKLLTNDQKDKALSIYKRIFVDPKDPDSIDEFIRDLSTNE